MFRRFVYNLWSIGIPVTLGFLVVLASSIYVLKRVEYASWKVGIAMLACLILSVVPAAAVMYVQSWVEHWLGWTVWLDAVRNETSPPPVYDDFYDQDDNVG